MFWQLCISHDRWCTKHVWTISLFWEVSFTDQNSADCCSSNGEGCGNHKSHSTPWKLLNSDLKGSLVIEACRITTISMAKLMQQNTQFQLPKIMPGPWEEFENFDLMGKFAETWHLKLVNQRVWFYAQDHWDLHSSISPPWGLPNYISLSVGHIFHQSPQLKRTLQALHISKKLHTQNHLLLSTNI